MIKAMIESNIPIDMIGGTSIGSFVGALWAEENSYDRFCDRAREWSFVSLNSVDFTSLDRGKLLFLYIFAENDLLLQANN
jgi:predicted acylesterase/phospholipase RssA